MVPQHISFEELNGGKRRCLGCMGKRTGRGKGVGESVGIFVRKQFWRRALSVAAFYQLFRFQIDNRRRITCMPVENVNIVHVMGQMHIHVTSQTYMAAKCKSPVLRWQTNSLTISHSTDKNTAPVFSMTACSFPRRYAFLRVGTNRLMLIEKRLRIFPKCSRRLFLSTALF